MALAVVTALLAIPIGIAAATNEYDEDREPTTAGEQLGGVVSVHGAELDGNLSERTYGVRIANAETDRVKASIVDERLSEIEDRIEGHEVRLAELEAEREAGNISEGTYRAQVATLTAEQASTERAAKRAGETARGLPEEALAERGVSTERIDELRANASNVGGPQQREIAREIAGPNVSTPGEDRPRTGDRRPATDRPLGTATAEDTDRNMTTGSERGEPNRVGSTARSPRDDVDGDASTEQTTTDGTDASTEQTTTDGTDAANKQTTTDGTDAANKQTTTDGTGNSEDQTITDEPTGRPTGGSQSPPN